MSEKKMELTPLKIRSHGASFVMQYDERYTPYIEMTGLLPFIQLGKRLCMSTDSEGWRQQMEALIDDKVIHRYARVYMWYVISRTIFVDDTGKNAPWMWLKALTVFDNKFSWGSAALAYLYRQLDDACRRTTKDGGVGGWLPIWAYKWDLVSEVASEVNLLYKQYTNEMDSLTPEQESTRVEICPPAYEEDILEEPTEYDALAQGDYNKLIREGYQTSFAPVLNFVRKEVKKQANESEDILEKTPGGKKGESALCFFIKEQGKKLRRISNILGCRDPEYVSPSRSGSSERNTLDDSTSSCARMDDGDITSAANTQRNTVEDDVDTPQVADGMTLKAFQRSAYMLKPRKEFRRYSPDDYAKGKNPVAGGSRLSRMRSMDDEDEDDDDDKSDDPEQFVVSRRKKLVSKRGRGAKM
ncbi:mutator protein [Hordeum vulgare]|nr:mutator protein [Hordeum vulgare]